MMAPGAHRDQCRINAALGVVALNEVIGVEELATDRTALTATVAQRDLLALGSGQRVEVGGARGKGAAVARRSMCRAQRSLRHVTTLEMILARLVRAVGAADRTVTADLAPAVGTRDRAGWPAHGVRAAGTGLEALRAMTTAAPTDVAL